MRHYIDSELISREISILLIGCGGTGSQILTGLARINRALQALGHEGLEVVVQDHDTVSEANIGRQLFYPEDINQYKSVCLVTRVNQAFGIEWKAMIEKFSPRKQHFHRGKKYDIIISATDNTESRLTISKSKLATYWLDIGNSKSTGQVILGNLKPVPQPKEMKNTCRKLPIATELYNLENLIEDDTPSCSLAEALNKQDLFINQMVASFALHLLWKAFRTGNLEQHGAYINLDTFRVNPLPVDKKIWERLKQ